MRISLALSISKRISKMISQAFKIDFLNISRIKSKECEAKTKALSLSLKNGNLIKKQTRKELHRDLSKYREMVKAIFTIKAEYKRNPHLLWSPPNSKASSTIRICGTKTTYNHSVTTRTHRFIGAMDKMIGSNHSLKNLKPMCSPMICSLKPTFFLSIKNNSSVKIGPMLRTTCKKRYNISMLMCWTSSQTIRSIHRCVRIRIKGRKLEQ